MGSSTSKPQQDRRRSSLGMSTPAQSPRHSAAFGRVGASAYSPNASTRGSIRASINAGSSLVKNIARAASLSHMSDRVAASEYSPLLQKHALELGRKLGEEDGPGGEISSPPLIIWIGPALACALAYALYNIFIKKGSASINPILGGVILQFVAALLGCILLGGIIYFNSGLDEGGLKKEEVLFWDWSGIRFAIFAGVAVGAAEMISFCVSGMGVQAMQSIPVIIGGSVLFGTVLGWACLGESLSARGWSGVILIAVGISLVGLDDDGEEMH